MSTLYALYGVRDVAGRPVGLLLLNEAGGPASPAATRRPGRKNKTNKEN